MLLSYLVSNSEIFNTPLIQIVNIDSFHRNWTKEKC